MIKVTGSRLRSGASGEYSAAKDSSAPEDIADSVQQAAVHSILVPTYVDSSEAICSSQYRCSEDCLKRL